MTPFAEEVFDIAPSMQAQFADATFFDLNHKSELIQKRIATFARHGLGFQGVTLDDGTYWIETSGHDPRVRVAFLARVKGIECVASVVIQADGKVGVLEGVVWAALSVLCPVARIMPVDGKCQLQPEMSVMLLACIEATQ